MRAFALAIIAAAWALVGPVSKAQTTTLDDASDFQVACWWNSTDGLVYRLAHKHNALSASAYGLNTSFTDVAGQGQVCSNTTDVRFLDQGTFNYTVDTRWGAGGSLGQWTYFGVHDRICSESPLQPSTSYTMTASYFERHYEGPFLVKNDSAAMDEVLNWYTGNLFDVVQYSSQYTDVYAPMGQSTCTTLAPGSTAPDYAGLYWVDDGGACSYYTPSLTVVSIGQDSIRLKVDGVGNSPYCDSGGISVMIWKADSAPGTPICSVHWNGQPSTTDSATLEFTIGKGQSILGPEWFNRTWNGPPPDCAYEALDCGARYRLVMYSVWGGHGYDSHIPTEGDVSLQTVRTKDCPVQGSLVAWGSNSNGQTNVSVLTDVQASNVQAIAAGPFNSAAISFRSVHVWGDNSFGQNDVPGRFNQTLATQIGVSAVAMGFGHVICIHSFTKVAGWGLNSANQTQVPPDLPDVAAVAAAGNHTLALLSAGTVVAWGSNAAGESSVPAGLANVVAIAAGDEHSLALIKNGTVVAWGSQAYNQSTVPEAALSNILSIAGGATHSLAVHASGAVVAWGSNVYGESDVPPAASANVSAVAAGDHYSLALLENGTIVCWGLMNNGQCYNTSALTRVAAIATGGSHGLAVLKSPDPPAPPPGPPPSPPPASPPSPPVSGPTPPAPTVPSPLPPPSTVPPSQPPSGAFIPSTGQPTNTGGSSGVPMAAIIGGVVGGVAVIAALGALGWWLRKRRSLASSGKEGSIKDHHYTSDGLLSGSQPTSGPSDAAHVTVQLQKGYGSLAADSKTLTMTSTAHTPHTGSTISGPSSVSRAVLPAALSYEVTVLKEVKIPWKSIRIGKELGAGGFGTVSRGIWQGNAVAVKMLNLKHMSSPAKDELRREALAMCGLRHPCIAQVFGLVDEEAHTALVMRYYQRGTVSMAISRPEYADLGNAQRIKMAMQVASGMCFLHERGLLHGDLKTSNLLIEDTGRGVVLADFGLSGVAGQAVTSGALTPSISPPEVLENPTAPRTRAGDVYAFAIVLLEIMSGLVAYRGIHSSQLKQLVCSGRRPGIHASVPSNIAAIITACWAQEASQRPDFAEIMERLEQASGIHGNPDGGYGDYDTQSNATVTKQAFTLADLTSTNALQ